MILAIIFIVAINCSYRSGYFIHCVVLKKLLSIKFHELAMHRQVGLLTDINSSVTDGLPIKYIVLCDIQLPIF